MATVCLDTNILVWGIKGECTPGQEGMIGRAQRFLAHLEAQKTTCIVPAVVVAELLMPLPLFEHQKFITDITRLFIVPSFDAITSTYLARVWQSKKGQVEMVRNEIKYDSFIIATALAHHATCIYSHDPNMRTMAQGHIDCLDIPDIPVQATLF